MTEALTPSVASGFCRRRWLLQHQGNGQYLADLAGAQVLWTSDPERAWSCLWPQRAAVLVRRMAERLPPVEQLKLVEARFTVRPRSHRGSWPGHG